MALEGQLIQQWKEIEDLEEDGAEDNFKSKKEQWFVHAFQFLRDLPEESHCWCGHKEIMLPLLEPFFSYSQETASNSSLRVLWRRVSREMRGCTRCVVQHHKAKEYYVSEFVEEVVKPLLDILRALDEERVAQHMKELVHKFKTDTMDPKEDSYEVICIMFEVLMFPFLMDDAEINETLKPFLLHVEETHDLSLAPGQRYPGAYRLLLHTDQGVRRIALKLAHSLPTFKDEQDMEPIQPTLAKCMQCLEYDTLDSSPQPTVKSGPPFCGIRCRLRTTFTKEALWIGLTTILGVLETPAFLKGVMEKYPVFVSIVLNHVSEATGVFWNALRCLKLLLEVLGYKLWLGTTFSPGVMRNTLLTQCFHSHEERMHVPIFDLFQPFLQSLEALQDGEYENQRRRLLYFLLQQVPFSSNFKSLMTKKARQIAFSIIGRGYSMDPPLPPVECVHVWGPPLIETLKDTSLIASLRKSATELIQSIIVADAAALAAVSAQQGNVGNVGKYSLDRNEDDGDEAAEETTDTRTEEVGDAEYWISFSSVSQSVEACEQWFCLPLLWVEVLNGILPMYLPLSLTKGIMWALGRLSLIDLDEEVATNNMVVTSNGVACSKDMSTAFKWVKPRGYDDGASGGCVNAVNAQSHHKELVGFLKKYAGKYLSCLQDGVYEKEAWTWEGRMAEPCILLPLDANASFREFGKEVLRRTAKASTLEAGLEVLCSSEASAAAVTRGLRHALKLLLHWPLNKCSRGLQQLFFHVWKLLTLSDKQAAERLTNPSQVSQGGGFLHQPKFQTLSLDSPPISLVNKLQRDEGAWRKLCSQVACQLWPLVVKTIIEGRQHWEGAGQLMTFTRMLQLLPCVFRSLNASQRKQVFMNNRSRPIPGGDCIVITWFEALTRWGDIPSPIIQRWWEEAVGSILENLKGWELVLPSELEDMIVDLKHSRQPLSEPRKLQLKNLLLSVPNLVLNHKFLDIEDDVIPLKHEKAWGPRGRQKAGDGNYFVLDSLSKNVKVRSPHNDVIDLTDHANVRFGSANDVIDLTEDAHIKLSSSSKEVINLTDYSESESSPSAVLYGSCLDRDDSLPPLQKQLDHSRSKNRNHSPLDSIHRGHFEKPEETQFRRPAVRQAPVSSSSKSATLDKFLEKFRNEQARKEVNKVGQVQGRNNLFKPPPAKGVTSRSQKGGSKLSSLRNEHRENLEQRSAVEDFVRSQVRERVERAASAKQPSLADVRPDDKRFLKVPSPDTGPPATSGTDSEPRSSEPNDSILRELVRSNEADPLDAALENVHKTQLLTQAVTKLKRKVITLEVPGESGRGTTLGKPQTGLMIKPRQTPRLDDWYRRILSLDYLSVVGISDENSSPGTYTSGEQLEKVPLTFRSPEQYMSIFRPLVLEEFKSQLQRSHEELNLSDGTTTGILRLMSLERVDDFQVGRFMAEAGADGAARACVDNELLLLSRQSLQSGSQSCHLLGKVESRDRESKSRATVLLLKLFFKPGDTRLQKAKRLLVDRSKWHVTRIMNITPQLRECQALSSLASLPLLPILLSPGSGHRVEGLENISRSVPGPLQSKLRGDYNESQLRAISTAIGGTETMTNDHQLTLVQGPPGTGKTKTIVAILSVLLAVRSSKKYSKSVMENESRNSSHPTGRTSAVTASSRDAAATSRVWQDMARAREMAKETETHTLSLQGQKQRVLVCAQSNAAVDEIVARICKNGLYGSDGSFSRPSVVRVGTLKSVHPKSMPVFIDTLVDARLGSEKESEAVQDNEQTKLMACRAKLEEVIEFIQTIEALRSQCKDIEGEKAGQKAGLLSESLLGAKAMKVIALGDSAVTGKLNLLYNQRRALTAEVATSEKEGKKAYEESKNRRKSIRRDIIRQADVVVTTLSGCGGDIYNVCMESLARGKRNNPVQDCFFDAVVIDEAAQALEPATLIPFQLLVQTNARCVMVGDPKQLPATVLSQMASRMQYECSMFERLQRAGYPVTMLSTQYRMHPEIRQFPSEHFYDNLISDGEGLKADRKAIFHRESGFGPYAFFDVLDGQESRKGGSASQSLSNEAEVAVALQIYLTLQRRYPAELWEGRVGVITPYKQQLRLLQEQFSRTLGPSTASEVEFNTVDGFQGREVDILILSTVRASSNISSKKGDIGFVADVRRMNVALTRARFSLWIIGNAATLQGNPSWASLLSNAKRRSLIFSLKKPYASFFQKTTRVDGAHSSRTTYTKPSEGYNVSQDMVETQIRNGDRWNKSALEVMAGRPKEKEVNMKESVATIQGSRREPDKAMLTREGQADGSTRQAYSSTRQADGSREQVASKYNRLSEGRFPMKDENVNDVRVQNEGVTKESSHHRHQERTIVKSNRHQAGQDEARVEFSAAERHVEDRSRERSRQDGSSADRKKHENRLKPDKERYHSENEETRPSGRLQSQSDTGCDGYSKIHLEGSKRDETTASQENSEDRYSRRRGRHEERSFKTDYKERKSPREEHNYLGKTRSIVDDTKYRSSVERSRIRDHRPNDGERADALRGSSRSSSRHAILPHKLNEGGERTGPPKESGPIITQEPASVKERRLPNVDRALHSRGTSLEQMTAERNVHSRGTNLEQSTADRKRKRAEVTALLPSVLLASSERPGSSGDQRMHRSRNSTAVRSQPSSDMDHEWTKFQRVLGGSDSTLPRACAARADSAPGVSIKTIRKPGRDSERPPSKQTEPLSDLDKILSGLSSVTRATQIGRNLDTSSKRATQTNGSSKTVASKHF